MKFYKIQGFIKENEPTDGDEEMNYRAERKAARKIALRIEEFNQKVGKNSHLGVSEKLDNLVVVCAITNEDINIISLAAKFYTSLGMEATDIQCEEITMSCYKEMLSMACREDFIKDDDRILDRFDIGDIFGYRHDRGLNYLENIIDVQTKEQLEENCIKYLATGSLLPEIERIYIRKTAAKVNGHPVQYILETDDTDIRNGICQSLISALYDKGRIKNRRYTYVNFRHNAEYSKGIFNSYYKSSEGGVMVVRFTPSSEEETEFASTDRDIIENIANNIKKYRNKTLTILCLPRECEKLKELFFEDLGNIRFVELKEDTAEGGAAKDFFKMLARETGVRTDKKLFSMLEEGKGYHSNELRDMFEKWYDEKLYTSIYPEYKDAKRVKKEIQAATPKGNAYDRLNEMIGLASAKKVINNALDYYKAQKLFRDKGMNEDRPAMHMAFTGSPGTCKTTAARLFAEIMKDNGILSEGHLVECGRADLVGKYVGWTAVQVKNLFKKAEGGVLFIDEAYSLVDDRNGMYGDEAINTIVQEMENHRDDMVVIFAGYPDKMEGFLNKNPGLRSRIAFHVPFDDYTPDELCDITKLIAKDKGLTIEPAGLDKLKAIYADEIKQPDFGNGRAARNIIEKARMAQASRLVKVDFDKVTKDDIVTIKAEDIAVPEHKTKQDKCIGFCA